MKRKFLISTITIFLSFSILAPNCHAAEYFLEPGGDFEAALLQLQAGDILNIRAGTYSHNSINLDASHSGRDGAPITVKAYNNEQVIIKSSHTIYFNDAHHWVFEGLIIEQPTGAVYQLGEHPSLSGNSTLLAHHLTFRNNIYRNGSYIIHSLRNADDIIIENNQFINLRPRAAFYTDVRSASKSDWPRNKDSSGEVIGEFNAVSVKYRGKNILIKNNLFEDMGSDGVQLGAQSYKSGTDIRAIQIVDNEFKVSRNANGKHLYRNINGDVVTRDCTDDGLDEIDKTHSSGYCDFAKNASENGIDIKKVGHKCCSKGQSCSKGKEYEYENCKILISGNEIHGFRPTSPSQDNSGENGQGITIHYDARNIEISANHFYDNTINLGITQGGDGTLYGGRAYEIFNNIFGDTQIFPGYTMRVNGINYTNKFCFSGFTLRLAKIQDVKVYNNTLQDDYFLPNFAMAGDDCQNEPHDYLLHLYYVRDIDFHNNIFLGADVSAKEVSNLNSSHNLWSEIKGAIPTVFNETASTDLKINFQTNSPYAMPQAGSAAIGAGENLYSQGVTADFAGTARPQSGNFTIGAYEYNANTASVTPSTGSQCHNIEVLINGAASSPSDEIKIGDQLQFVCDTDFLDDQTVQFRIKEPLAANYSFDNLNTNITDNVSDDYSVQESGSFVVQCAICDSSGKSCAWEDFIVNSNM